MPRRNIMMDTAELKTQMIEILKKIPGRLEKYIKMLKENQEDHNFKTKN